MTREGGKGKGKEKGREREMESEMEREKVNAVFRSGEWALRLDVPIQVHP